MNSLLTNLADELLLQGITQPSVVLGPLSDDDLQAAYDFVLERFALELLIGARNSDWSNGNLVIAAKHGPFHSLQTALYAVRLELQQRKTAVVCSYRMAFPGSSFQDGTPYNRHCLPHSNLESMPRIGVGQAQTEGRRLFDQFFMHQCIRLVEFKRSRDHG